MNRAQNLSIVTTCLAPNWTCLEVSSIFPSRKKLIQICFHNQIHTERPSDQGWLDIQEHPVFSPDGDSFLMLAAVQEGNTETYTHIKHITVTQQHIAVLSHGPHEVEHILSWDTARDLM